jgi:hypothetical protein
MPLSQLVSGPVSEFMTEPGPSIQTFPAASATSPPVPHVPSVQRALEDAPPPVDTAPSPSAPGTTGAPEAQAGGGATQDLDDLAHRLYPKIRPYLKRELWLDRERAGSLTGLS